MEHETFREWLDLAADGALEESARRELEAHVGVCDDCRAEQRRALALTERLTASRVAVRPGFTREVLAALEPAPWESRGSRAWRWPFAALLLLAGGAAAIYGSAAAGLEPAGRSWAALTAFADLIVAALGAGTGLATATWKGVGAAVGDWLDASPANWVAAAVVVVGLNVLAFRLAHGRARATARVDGDSERSGR